MIALGIFVNAPAISPTNDSSSVESNFKDESSELVPLDRATHGLGIMKVLRLCLPRLVCVLCGIICFVEVCCRRGESESVVSAVPRVALVLISYDTLRAAHLP